MSELTNDEWVALKDALDAIRSGNGRPLRDERCVVEGVIWRLRSSAKWRAVPRQFGPWWWAAQLHIRWSRTGVWQRAFEHLRDEGHADLADVFMDGTSIRAHQEAAGAIGGPRASGSAARGAATAPRP